MNADLTDILNRRDKENNNVCRAWPSAALRRVSIDSDVNRFGLNPDMALGALAAIAIFVWVHNNDRPEALMKALRPTALESIFTMAGEGLRCQAQGIGHLIKIGSKPQKCDIDEMIANNPNNSGLFKY